MPARLPARWWSPLVIVMVMLAASCTDASDATEPGGADEPVSEPDWEALYLAEVERLSRDFEERNGQPPPDDVTFVRFIDAWEFGEVHAECVRGRGFDVEVTFDGGVSYGTVPRDQELALHEAIYRCQVAYPVHPRYRLPWTEQMIRVLYEYYVDELVPCLVDQGYPAQEPPSWETFLASHGTEREWNPYAVVVDRDDPQEWRAINETCPQAPPDAALYGSAHTDGG